MVYYDNFVRSRSKVYTFDYESKTVHMTKILLHEFSDVVDSKLSNEPGPGRSILGVESFLLSEDEEAYIHARRLNIFQV